MKKTTNNKKAMLSQRNRAMLRGIVYVTNSHSRSFKVISLDMK